MTELQQAIADGQLGDRLWLYSNYHCNLRCSYCLTESSPSSPRRTLDANAMVELSRQAAALGFHSVGITGGEPFLVPSMPDTLAAIAAHLPVVALSNGTLFGDKLLERMAPLAGLDVSIQLSLDAADAANNDANRADGNHALVVEAMRALRALDIRVRIATTGVPDPHAHAALCELHLALGIPDTDHVIRPVVRRGRSAADPRATSLSTENLAPELTITSDGAYWSPFAPTVTDGRVDTDLLICRITSPLDHPVAHILHAVHGRPAGAHVASGIP